MQTHMAAAAARVPLSETRTVCYSTASPPPPQTPSQLLLTDFRLRGPPRVISPLVEFIPINSNIALIVSPYQIKKTE